MHVISLFNKFRWAVNYRLQKAEYSLLIVIVHIYCQIKVRFAYLFFLIKFLRKIVKSRQWKCWERLYFLLYKLLKAGVLVYPVPNLISDSQETNDNTPSRLFYLLDWSSEFVKCFFVIIGSNYL